MLAGGQEGADVAVEDEVGLGGAPDRLFDLRICLPDEVSEIAAVFLLPRWMRQDVSVDARMRTVAMLGMYVPNISIVRSYADAGKPGAAVES